MDAALPVRDPHPANNIRRVFMQQRIELLHALCFLGDNADHCHTVFHLIHSKLCFSYLSIFPALCQLIHATLGWRSCCKAFFTI